jgi:tRNA/rRNA methyltransferase
MMNCALDELRIVDPRDPWPLEETHRQRMLAASSGADAVLNNAKVFPTLEAAIADLNYVYATTARSHHMVTRIFTARTAIPDMAARIKEGQKVGVLFGRERTGLVNEHLALANAKITIPLNLAQAVLLIGYEWYQSRDETPGTRVHLGGSRPASREEYINFYKRLEDELEACGFFVTDEMRPSMTKSLQAMLQRAEMTDQEIRTWHGVLKALAQGPKRTKKP